MIKHDTSPLLQHGFVVALPELLSISGLFFRSGEDMSHLYMSYIFIQWYFSQKTLS